MLNLIYYDLVSLNYSKSKIKHFE